MVRLFIGLVLQILSIYLIGNAFALEQQVEDVGIILMSCGTGLWVFSHFLLYGEKMKAIRCDNCNKELEELSE